MHRLPGVTHIVGLFRTRPLPCNNDCTVQRPVWGTANKKRFVTTDNRLCQRKFAYGAGVRWWWHAKRHLIRLVVTKHRVCCNRQETDNFDW